MTIAHNIKTSMLPLPVSGDIASQLSGLLGQAQGLVSAGVGLPALQSIGTQIATIGSAIATAGTQQGVDTSSISQAVTNIGTQMSTASMSQMSGLVSSLSGQLSSLTSLMNPSGMFSQILHSHVLDKIKGIVASAFQGQHTTTWDQNGVTHTSSTKVSSSAPSLPHNGLTLVSDALNVTKGITGQSFSMLSDRRLKFRIKDHPSVLAKVLKLRLKTFMVRAFDWETGQIVKSVAPRASIGFIAQEIQKVFPQLVRKEGKYLVVEEEKIGPILAAALQEFVVETRTEIAALRAEIAEMKRA